MDWISGPLEALVWICGIAWILHRTLLRVKLRVGTKTYWLEPQDEKPRPAVYLSDHEEIERERRRHAQEGAISKR